MRWFGLVLLLSLAACDEPRSAAYSPERGSSFEPVAVELESAQLAQKIGTQLPKGPRITFFASRARLSGRMSVTSTRSQ